MGGLVIDLLVGVVLVARTFELIVGGVQTRPVDVRARVLALVILGGLLVVTVINTNNSFITRKKLTGFFS